MTDPILLEREALEATLWEMTEWRGSAELMVKLLNAIDHYADMKHGVVAPHSSMVGITAAREALSAKANLGITDVDEEDEGPSLPWGAHLEPEERQCRACLRVKPETDFTKDTNSKGGRLTRCKSCVKNKYKSVAITR